MIDHLATQLDLCVRKAMARCPRLPADRLNALLDDPELAEDAAANPSLDWKTVAEAMVTPASAGRGRAR